MNYKDYAIAHEARPEILSWIETILAKYLTTNPENQSEIEHIIDYLLSDAAPQRLSSMNYEQAKNNTDKWVKTLVKKGEHIKETPEDTELVLDFKDGFKVVKLIGKNAFEREGYLMRHCAASYADRKDTEVFSLRDANNYPHATFEKNRQIKGKGNGSIHPKYVDYVVQFLEQTGMTVGKDEMGRIGYYDVSSLKDKLSKDTEYFRDVYVHEDTRLLSVDGFEYVSLDLWDIKPLIKSTVDAALKINFDLNIFVPTAIKRLHEHGTDTREEVQSASGVDSQLAASGYNSKLATSGDYSKLAASGDYSQLAASGGNSKLATSGVNSKLAASGVNSKLAASGDYSKLAASGDYSQLAASGGNSKLATSGVNSQLAASGVNSKLAASGYNSKLATSGVNSQLAASGDYSRLEINGAHSIGANIGFSGIIKGIKGSWITLAEYDKDRKPILVKSAQIDGEVLKENTWYKLEGGEFREGV